MNKILALVLLSGIFATACNTQRADSYTITGKITGMDTGHVYLYDIQNEDAVPDTAVIKNGSFEFTGSAEEPKFVYLGLGESVPVQPLGFFLENSRIVINGSIDSLAKAKITGSTTHAEFEQYNSGFAAIREQQRSLIEEYQDADVTGDITKMEEIRNRFQLLEGDVKNLVNEFVKAHPASYVSPFLLAQSASAMDAGAEELEPLYNALSEKTKNSFFGKEVAKTLEVLKKTSIGAVAPDFTLNDPKGNPVSLSSFKGKYTLVDFWASWCGPCRVENPNVVKAYQAFQSKGFDILGVSLDESREHWEKAIVDDQLAWTQVADIEKGGRSDVAIEYGIKGIPMNFLLDREGKIIAKNLRGAELIQKLQEVLN
ncbi:MAG: AhpC/TSA family protein [Chitinophagaceae bacterium]|nr:AhpC/TSA family protein [Chitinophagaceae bacterium]MCW5928748.1 AhpC/TSA family protein [Chitinophagaceae bacterium]